MGRLLTRRVLVFWCVACGLMCAATGAAQPATVLEFPIGSGTDALGCSPRVASSGPIQGPVAMQSRPGGLTVLDSENNRLVELRLDGGMAGTVGLPPGAYQDLVLAADGVLWTADEEARAVVRIDGASVTRAFSLPAEVEPHQIDALAVTRAAVVIGDFSSQTLSWWTPEGTLTKIASWPPSLGLITNAGDSLCFLALGEDDLYNKLHIIHSSGEREEVTLEGEALEGARVIGSLPDGRLLGLGNLSAEPLIKQIFLIQKDGLTVPLVTIPAGRGFVWSARPAIVAGNSVWMQTSPLDQEKIRFSRFEVNP